MMVIGSFETSLLLLFPVVILLILWFVVRTITKKIANYTEERGDLNDTITELKNQIAVLNDKLSDLENKIGK